MFILLFVVLFYFFNKNIKYLCLNNFFVNKNKIKKKIHTNNKRKINYINKINKNTNKKAIKKIKSKNRNNQTK